MPDQAHDGSTPGPPDVVLSAEALERIRHGVRLLALHELGDAELADEVAQETLARLVQAIREGRLREASMVGAFARGVARHVVADVIRLRRRHVEIDAVGSHPTLASQDDALAALVSADQTSRVRQALRELTDADRDLIRLIYFDGLTSEAVAARLGEPAARVRKRKERALERLRRAFLSLTNRGEVVADTLRSGVGVSARLSEQQ